MHVSTIYEKREPDKATCIRYGVVNPVPVANAPRPFPLEYITIHKRARSIPLAQHSPPRLQPVFYFAVPRCCRTSAGRQHAWRLFCNNLLFSTVIIGKSVLLQIVFNACTDELDFSGVRV